MARRSIDLISCQRGVVGAKPLSPIASCRRLQYVLTQLGKTSGRVSDRGIPIGERDMSMWWE
jgi:hypothetical protein